MEIMEKSVIYVVSKRQFMDNSGIPCLSCPIKLFRGNKK